MKDSSPGKAETFFALAKQLAEKEAKKGVRLDEAIEEVIETNKKMPRTKALLKALMGLFE